jgi:two-component system, NarL family, sensor histidine kinase DegS
VSLQCKPDEIELIIKDNGKGFSLEASRPGSLGLGIMQERAQSFRATINIESLVDKGTMVTVIWKNDARRSVDGRVVTN